MPIPAPQQQAGPPPVGQLRPINTGGASSGPPPVGELKPIQQAPHDWHGDAQSIARQNQIDPDLFNRLIGQESNWDEKALSPKGAKGLTQLMPNTAQGMGIDPDNPQQNLQGGARELHRLLQKYGGDVNKALAAYNAGEGNVDKYGGIPPFQETQDYVSKITQGYNPPPKPVGQLTPIKQQPSATDIAFKHGTEPPPGGDPWPQWFETGLEKANQYGVQPFNKMSQWGAEKGSEAVQGLTEPFVGIADLPQLLHSISPYGPTPAGTTPTIEENHPIATGLARSVGGVAGGTLADPRQWPFLFSGGAAPALQKLASGGFAAQMGYGAVKGSGELGTVWDDSNVPQSKKVEMASDIVLNTLMAGMSGAHAITSPLSRPGGQVRTGAETSPEPQSGLAVTPPTQTPTQQPTRPSVSYGGQEVIPRQIEGFRKIVQRRASPQEATIGGAKEAQGGPSIQTATRMGGGAKGQIKSLGVSGPDETAEAPKVEQPTTPTPKTPQELEDLRQRLRQATGKAGPPPVGKLTPIEVLPTERVSQMHPKEVQDLEQRSGKKFTTEAEATAERKKQADWDVQSALGRGKVDTEAKNTVASKGGTGESSQLSEFTKTPPQTRGPMIEKADQAIHPEEKAELEKKAGRPLSEEEAYKERDKQQAWNVQEALKTKKVDWQAKESAGLRERQREEAQKPKEQPVLTGPSEATRRAQDRQMTERSQDDIRLRKAQLAYEQHLKENQPKWKEQSAKEDAAFEERRKQSAVAVAEPHRTPSDTPASAAEKRAGAPARESLENLEKRVRSLPNAKSEMLNNAKSAIRKTSGSDQEFTDRWQKALSAYEKQLGEGKPPKKPREAGFLSLGGRRTTGPTISQRIKDYITDQTERTRISKGLQEGIYDLGSLKNADVLRAVKLLKESKGSKADYEAIYHFLEDHNSPLTGKQAQMYINEIHPLVKENARIVDKLNGMGIPTDQYVHRIPVGKNTKLEMVLKGQRRYSAGASLTQSSSALKGRTMFALDHPDVGRIVVSRKGGKVMGWLGGQSYHLGDAKALEEAGAKFSTATTKEIEANTGTKYLKHALVNTLVSHVDLKRAERAMDFLQSFKDHPDFDKVAWKLDQGTRPPGYEQSIIPAMRDYAFEPKTKEVLDHYWNKLNKGEPEALEKLNHYLRNSIFFNPLIHVPNIANHWAVEKGISGWMPQNWGRIAKTSARAIDAVVHQNKDFLDALDAGAPLQSQRFTNREATNLLVTKMAQQMHGNPKLGQRVASMLGYGSPVELIKKLYDFSGKATWNINDIAVLQATYEHMDKHGGDFKSAVKEVSKHIPDYRLPTRILNSRSIGKLMENQNLTMFGAYHYGALKSYVEMAKDLVGPSTPPADRAKALDRIGMIGLMTFGIYHAMDAAARYLSGDEKAKVRRAGASTFVDNVYQVAKGKKDIVSALSSSVTPAPVIKTVGELAFNRRFLTNQQIRDKKAPAGTQLKQTGRYLIGQTGPTSSVERAKGQTGHFDWKRFLWGLAGVSVDQPTSGGPNRGMSGVAKLGGLGSLRR